MVLKLAESEGDIPWTVWWNEWIVKNIRNKNKLNILIYAKDLQIKADAEHLRNITTHGIGESIFRLNNKICT